MQETLCQPLLRFPSVASRELDRRDARADECAESRNGRSPKSLCRNDGRRRRPNAGQADEQGRKAKPP